MSYDVFSDENKVKGNWFQKKVPGTTLQGTFIGKSQRPNFLQGGQLCWVYEIKSANGEIWLVQGNAAIDAQMKHIKLGQVVGFKYIGESTKHAPGKNAAKIVQVYANPKLVDEAWLQEQEDVSRVVASGDEDDIIGGPGGMDIDKIPGFENTPTKPSTAGTPAVVTAAPAPTVTDKLNLIGELAKAKLGVTNVSDVKLKVMEATNLAFIDSNLDLIIKALQAK